MSKKSIPENSKLVQLSFLDSLAIPLPLMVAKKYNFPLQTHQLPNYRFAIQDWIAGVALTPNPRDFWQKLKKRTVDTMSTVEKLPYNSSNGKVYQMDFTTDEGLYRITQRMDASTGIRDEVLAYLAKAGAKLDEYRLDPESAVTDSIGQYQAHGKDNEWIAERLKGIDARKTLTNAIAGALHDMPDNMYRQTTETLYRGLWERVTAILRQDLGMPAKGGNVRDHFGTYALIYTGLAERVAGELIAQAGDLTPAIVMEIVWKVASMIKKQANETSQFLGRDLVTDKPLLTGGAK